MKQGNAAELKAIQMLRLGQEKNNHTYVCEVVSYDIQRAILCLVLKADELTELSLDAIYECRVFEEERALECTGRICERYQGEEGKVLCLKVENGFYKISTK